MSIYDKASLVLIPSGSKTSKVYSQKPTNGDGDFTFSRSTAATRVNASGNIEKETQNLLLDSNNFGTSNWLNYQLTRAGGQSGYDGSNDAWIFTKTATGFANIRQAFTAISGVYTYSAYIKAGTNTSVIMRCLGTSDHQWAIDLSNGTSLFTSSNIIDTNIEDVGSGWYRCSMAFNANAVSNTYFYPEYPFNGTTAGSIYVQDAQLEQGLVARDYIETTTTAIYGGITDNVPRLDYTDSSCPALLLEPQRTNIVEHSEYFEGWANNVADARTANSAISPEGLQNAYLIETSSHNTGVYKIPSTHLNSGDVFTASVYLKAKTGTGSSIVSFGLGATAFGGDRTSRFDLSNGTISYTNPDHDSVSIEDAGDGWYRCIVTDTATASGAFALVVYSYLTSPVSCDWYMYGAVGEAGSYATSYIPTYGSAVTRNADDCRITGVSSIVSASEYTIFWEGSHIATGDYNSFATIFNNSAVNQSSRFYRNNTDNQIYAAAFISGSSVTLGSGVTDEYAKCAFRVKSGDFALYVNGSLVASSTSTMTPSATLDSISMQYFYSSQSFDQRTQQFMFFNQALTNEELATLTTI